MRNQETLQWLSCPHPHFPYQAREWITWNAHASSIISIANLTKDNDWRIFVVTDSLGYFCLEVYNIFIYVSPVSESSTTRTVTWWLILGWVNCLCTIYRLLLTWVLFNSESYLERKSLEGTHFHFLKIHKDMSCNALYCNNFHEPVTHFIKYAIVVA